MICYHTYLYWNEDKKAVCAVCKQGFDYEYDPNFVGTFVREKYVRAHTAVRVAVATTHSLYPCEAPRLDDVF